LQEQILALPKVQHVKFKSNAKVLQELQASLGSLDTSAISGKGLFPDVIEVEVSRDIGPKALSFLKLQLQNLSQVAEVDFSEDWLSQYKMIKHFLRVFGFILFFGILFSCSFIIANFMGMRHQSRKYEIDIIRLMGAHRGFVFGPFLWEGIIEGTLGA